MGFVIKLVLLAALGAGAWFGYQKFFAPPSAAQRAYEAYASLLDREQYDDAVAISAGAARAHAEATKRKMNPATPKIFGQTIRPYTVAEIAGEIAWIKNTVKAETKSPDGTTELTVSHTVCRIPPGVTSATCKWPVNYLQYATVKPEGARLVVSQFSSERTTPMK